MTCYAHSTASTAISTAEPDFDWIGRYIATTSLQLRTANLGLESLMKTANKILQCFDHLSWTRESLESPLLASGDRGFPFYPLLAYHRGLAQASSIIRLSLESHSTTLESKDPVRGLAVIWMMARLQREEDNIKDQQFDALGFADRGGKACSNLNVNKFGMNGRVSAQQEDHGFALLASDFRLLERITSTLDGAMSSHPAETATLYRSMLATCQVATEHFSDLLDDLHATSYYDTTPNGRACRQEAIYLSRKTEKRLLTLPKVLQDMIPEGILTESFGDGSTAGIPCMLVDTESIETDKAESIKYYGGIDGVLQWYNEYSGGIGAA